MESQRAGSIDPRAGRRVDEPDGLPVQRSAPRAGGHVPSSAPSSAGRAAARRAASGRRGRNRPRKRGLRILAYTTAGVVLATAGAGGCLYLRLSGNIKHSPLFAGVTGDAGHETPDAFGRTPINLLVIGSDSRDNAADCAIGGDCGPGANADVEMLLHVSADRSNATVMSIPRDTMTYLPACNDTVHRTSMKAQQHGQINSTLDYGPGCTVAAVHQLTGIPIDHFMTVDFTGVVQMSDAIGGVPVCVSDNVYDPDSHLKLAKGTHTLKGMSALQFVRTRHGFGDGSDLGRAAAQHAFIGSMVRELKSAGTLTDPGKVLGLADAATKALTVDDALKGVPQLVGLANDLNKVPADRITFTTMQNEPYPADTDRVQTAPAAKNLFNAIINDQSLTTGSGDKSAAAATATAQAPDPATSAPAAPTAAAPPAGSPKKDIAVRVRNGSGAAGRAGTVAGALRTAGFSSASAAPNAPATAKSVVTYPAGREADAQQVAAAVHLPASAVQPGEEGAGITLVIGSDWTGDTTFAAAGGGASGTPAPVDTKAALSDANVSTADDDKSCTQVSHLDTVKLNDVGMTPVQAYARARNVPDSAP